MTKSIFLSMVIAVLNERSWDDSGADENLAGSDTEGLDGLIETAYPQAWRKALALFPKSLFHLGSFADNTVSHDVAHGTGHIVLPNDFFDLYEFRLEGWHKPVHAVCLPDDAVGRLQWNEYTRGSITRPVCMLDTLPNETGTQNVLRYFSLPPGSDAKVSTALYVIQEDELKDDMQLDERMQWPLAYLCASVVYALMEQPKAAEALAREAIARFNAETLNR